MSTFNEALSRRGVHLSDSDYFLWSISLSNKDKGMYPTEPAPSSWNVTNITDPPCKCELWNSVHLINGGFVDKKRRNSPGGFDWLDYNYISELWSHQTGPQRPCMSPTHCNYRTPQTGRGAGGLYWQMVRLRSDCRHQPPHLKYFTWSTLGLHWGQQVLNSLYGSSNISFFCGSCCCCKLLFSDLSSA